MTSDGLSRKGRFNGKWGIFVWPSCFSSGCLEIYLLLLIFSLYDQGEDATMILYYPPALISCISVDLEYFILPFPPSIYIVLALSSLITDHTVLPRLLQCVPSPRIPGSIQVVQEGCGGRGYISLSCPSTRSLHAVLCPSSCSSSRSPLLMCFLHEATWRSFDIFRVHGTLISRDRYWWECKQVNTC